MSCDSHSLGDIPGENTATITLQSILVPSTNVDDTDELSWGFGSILPVHTTEVGKSSLFSSFRNIDKKIYFFVMIIKSIFNTGHLLLS